MSALARAQERTRTCAFWRRGTLPGQYSRSQRRLHDGRYEDSAFGAMGSDNVDLFGLPYKGAYDNFLIIVSFVFNALTVWYAWKWVV